VAVRILHFAKSIVIAVKLRRQMFEENQQQQTLKTQKLLQEKSEEEVCLIMNLLIFEAST
jgi:protein subunit release factor B